VLGSRGSVVETFKQQIALGGPVTVTHPDMMRYFMTVPEAVQLVLQAATLGQCGEVFMLDMGERVKIVDLAHDLIELSGLTVGRDIDIIFTGARPGEKLAEELHLASEEYEPTQHKKILLIRQATDLLPQQLKRAVGNLVSAAQENNQRKIISELRLLVPEYQRTGPGRGRRSIGYEPTAVAQEPGLQVSRAEARTIRVDDLHPSTTEPLKQYAPDGSAVGQSTEPPEPADANR
jgi:FlaA1/EpsC-like NDP-sugar epimerase